MFKITLFVVLTLFCATQVSAASTVGCHCFQDRQYQPQNSHAADPYFLATTQNSLMAVLFSIEKKSLVRAKMSGADGEELWIAHYLARESGQSLSDLKRMRSDGSSWTEVVEQLQIAPDQLDAQARALLDEPDELAGFIVDDALATELQVKKEELTQVRRLGVGNRELILSVLLARVGSVQPERVYVRFQKGESWGKLLHDQGLFDGAGIEQRWRVLLKE